MQTHYPPTSTIHALENVAKHFELNVPVNFKSFTTIETNLSHILSAGKQCVKKLKLIGALMGKLRMQA